MSGLPAIGLAFLPKCPLCLAAWGASLGAGWLVALGNGPWIYLLLGGALALHVAVLYRTSRFETVSGRVRRGPLYLAILAAVAILLGRFVVDVRTLLLGGVAALFAATAWRALPALCRRPDPASAAVGNCTACARSYDASPSQPEPPLQEVVVSTHRPHATRWHLTFVVGALLTAPALVADATPGPCPFVDIDVARYGNQPFKNPPEIRAGQDGHVETTLSVEYTDPRTTTLGGCPVTLRSYNGQLVGPTLRVPAGGVLDVLLANRLPVESPDEQAAQIGQQAANAHLNTRPHSYNTTNLHTHGLHVSPSGNSDNVLLAIPPQTSFPYEVKLPPNHPPGSFWYHAHTHGSTAIQVGSSMGGALIVEDDPTTLPPALAAANEREKVMVFQTILYDTHGRVDDITAFFPDGSSSPADCAAGKSNCTWQSSKRRTTINGQIVPIITMRPGEVQRWRMVDAAFRETLNIRLEGHPLHEIALDGLYLGRIDTWAPTQVVQLQPGYRSDVLVQASSKPGTYRLLDAGSGGATATGPSTGLPYAAATVAAAAAEVTASFVPAVGLRGVAEGQNVLALVMVEGKPLPMQLPTNEEMAKLAPFPGVDLRQTADGVQEVAFKLGSSVDPKDTRNYFQVNYSAFNPSHIRYLQLGRTEMWALRTVGDPPGVPSSIAIPPLPHVFHIHVNPFQVVRQDPAGKDELVWKDTLLVPPPPQGQSEAVIDIYTQYTDYIGQFVLHCHILDHEDLGMMEVVEVVGEQPASALPVHGGHGGH